jgi:hypothetical protein
MGLFRTLKTGLFDDPPILRATVGDVWGSFCGGMVPGATYFPFRKGDGGTDLPFYIISMEALAEWLSENAETPILDKTGLAGNYDVVLNKRQKEG